MHISRPSKKMITYPSKAAEVNMDVRMSKSTSTNECARELLPSAIAINATVTTEYGVIRCVRMLGVSLVICGW